jgi:lipopolysaccharide/colanic/teichoic acid biosynthesis glycosyltransferase
MKKKYTYLIYLFIDIIFLIFSFLFFAKQKPGTVARIIPAYDTPFLWFSLFWLAMSILGNKYKTLVFANLSRKIAVILKNNFTIVALITISMFVFHTFSYSRFIVLGTILAATILELLAALTTSYLSRFQKDFDDASTLKFTPSELYSGEELFEKKEYHFSLPKCKNVENSTKSKLEKILAEKNRAVLEFINEHIDISVIHKKYAEVLNTHTLFNISNFDPESLILFMNLHNLNDFRRINVNFIKVNESLKFGGYYIGCGVTLKENYKHIFSTFPFGIAHLIYIFDFIIRRLLPKIPVFKGFYFFLTKGENRAVSRAEILGRLYFCGFRVINETEINNKLYFIAQKITMPKTDDSPSYGPLIKMKRVGQDKKIFYIYKFRTMHPYSEYLQQYIYDSFQLEEGGKFKNDFRRTAWGTVFRKLWIDELPQLINFFQGEVALFGVRALSEHYFSLYPPDMQDLRTKVKPGLVPPFYADMPTTFEEIIESERRYVEKRLKKGFIVDVEYFCKAWYNIIFKHARSN